jgi:hypothetical protein
MNLNIFAMGCQQRTFNFNSRKPCVYNREKQLITKKQLNKTTNSCKLPKRQSASNWNKSTNSCNFKLSTNHHTSHLSPHFATRELQVQEANVPCHVYPNNAKMPSSKTAFQFAPPQYSKQNCTAKANSYS